MLMGLGIGLMILGFLAMIGGGYSDFDTPNYDVKYGFRTTILAPILVLTGLVVNGFAIMKKPSQDRIDYVMNEVFVSKAEEAKRGRSLTESGKRLRKKSNETKEEIVAETKTKQTVKERKAAKKAARKKDKK